MPSPLLERFAALAGSSRPAVLDDLETRSFAELWDGALRARTALAGGASSLEGARVLLLARPGAAWVEAFLGILLAGGVAVPLSPAYPPAELAYFASDCGAELLVASDDLAELARPLAQGRRALRLTALREQAPGGAPAASSIPGATVAVLLYTSGTTGKPKGAMLTHENLALHTRLLREAWAMSEQDVLLHALPLHHLHGLAIALLTALSAGAAARMLPRFEAARVAALLASREATVWMGVPTMYQKFLEHLDSGAAPSELAGGARALRLATSGSAALPVTLAERWEALAGAIPLERFGMTEIGVGASNPLAPGGRRAGTVGPLLPTVEARIVGDAGEDLEGGPGELWVRGPSVFAGYFGREEATRAAFRDGWFLTGDVAERTSEGYLRLLGRTSVDILKSGGYKLSALEIEEALRENDAIAEVAVVGLPDATWGDRVVAVVVPAPGREADCAEERLRAWAKERLAAYKVPRQVVLAAALPRNAMGKVVKGEIVRGLVSRCAG